MNKHHVDLFYKDSKRSSDLFPVLGNSKILKNDNSNAFFLKFDKLIKAISRGFRLDSCF